MAAPVKKVGAGAISCSLWENQIAVGGIPTMVLKATVERRYKDQPKNRECCVDAFHGSP